MKYMYNWSPMVPYHGDALAGNISKVKMPKKWLFWSKMGFFCPKNDPKVMKNSISHKFPDFGGYLGPN